MFHPSALVFRSALARNPIFYYLFFLLSDVHDRPDDFEPQISVSRGRSHACLGDVTATPVFSFCARETDTVQDAVSGVSAAGDAKAGFFFSRSETREMNLMVLSSAAEPLSSVTGL